MSLDKKLRSLEKRVLEGDRDALEKLKKEWRRGNLDATQTDKNPRRRIFRFKARSDVGFTTEVMVPVNGRQWLASFTPQQPASSDEYTEFALYAGCVKPWRA